MKLPQSFNKLVSFLTQIFFVTVYKRSQYRAFWHFGVKRHRKKTGDFCCGFGFDRMFFVAINFGGILFLFSFSLYISFAFACLVPAI